MSRYKALRQMGCDPLTAGFINLMNLVREVPQGQIRFLHMHIDYDVTSQKASTP